MVWQERLIEKKLKGDWVAEELRVWYDDETKGNAHVNFSKPIAENVLGHNSAICEATDPIFWVVCPLGGYFWKT